jgi:hypothetical protein
MGTGILVHKNNISPDNRVHIIVLKVYATRENRIDDMKDTLCEELGVYSINSFKVSCENVVTRLQCQSRQGTRFETVN